MADLFEDNINRSQIDNDELIKSSEANSEFKFSDIYKKNIEIPNIEKIKNNDSFFIYHAGTEKKDNKLYATGGRVLNFVSISDNFKSSRDNVIKEIKNLNWDNGFYRRDIGYKIIDK